MTTLSNNIQSSVDFDSNSSFTDLSGSSRDSGPPNYCNIIKRSMYPLNDGTGNVSIFIILLVKILLLLKVPRKSMQEHLSHIG